MQLQTEVDNGNTARMFQSKFCNIKKVEVALIYLHSNPSDVTAYVNTFYSSDQAHAYTVIPTCRREQ